MPLHRIYTVKGVFSSEDKAAIAESITKVYSMLPKFYVVVTFVEADEDSFFVGGKPSKFVRIISHHLARTAASLSPERTEEIVDAIQAAFDPFVRNRGLGWEFNVEWHDRETWRENGLKPPMPDTEAEKVWRKLDKPVPF